MHAANILNLGLKELRGLARDPGMLALIAFAFTISIYTASTAMPEQLNKTPIAIVDEDRSPLSTRLRRTKRKMSALCESASSPRKRQRLNLFPRGRYAAHSAHSLSAQRTVCLP